METRVSPLDSPNNKAAQDMMNQEVLPQTPGYAEEILGRKNRPHEQMCSKHAASQHGSRESAGNEQRGETRLLHQSLPLSGTGALSHQYAKREGPPDRTCPIADECEDADGYYVVVDNAVVGIGQINGRYCVRATMCKIGCMLKYQRSHRDLVKLKLHAAKEPRLQAK